MISPLWWLFPCTPLWMVRFDIACKVVWLVHRTFGGVGVQEVCWLHALHCVLVMFGGTLYIVC